MTTKTMPEPTLVRMRLSRVYALLISISEREEQGGAEEKGEGRTGATLKTPAAGTGPAAGDGRHGPGSLHLPPESISGDAADVKSETGAVAK